VLDRSADKTQVRRPGRHSLEDLGRSPKAGVV